MVYKQSFDKGLGDRSELFSSFFSAIQNFVKQMMLNDAREKGLESIDLGKYLVNLTSISSLDVDLVIIADKEDKKPIRKFIPKVVLLLESHREIFDNWDGNLNRLDVLDVEFIQLLKTNKKLSGQDDEGGNKTELMDAILDQLPELEKNQKQKYLEEKAYFENLLKQTKSIYRKMEIIRSIEEVCRKLQDRLAMEETLKKKRKIKSEMKILEDKLIYYIRQTKSCISEAVEKNSFVPLHQIDFKDAYIHLYSFSSNLKQFGKTDAASKYREWAMELIKKPEEKEKSNLGDIIQTVLHMSEEINFYLPNLSEYHS